MWGKYQKLHRSFAPAHGRAGPPVQKGRDHPLPPAGAALCSHAWGHRGDRTLSLSAPITCLSSGLTKKKKDCYFSAMRNQHLWYSWGLIPLIFLVNTTGNVPSIPVPPLMYFFNFFIAYFVSHKLKGQHHSMLIYCSQGKISPYVTTHCCWLRLSSGAMGESESHPSHSWLLPQHPCPAAASGCPPLAPACPAARNPLKVAAGVQGSSPYCTNSQPCMGLKRFWGALALQVSWQ